jgi:hypothetical protein
LQRRREGRALTRDAALRCTGTLFKNSNRKAQAMEAFEKLSHCREKLGECVAARRRQQRASACERLASVCL